MRLRKYRHSRESARGRKTITNRQREYALAILCLVFGGIVTKFQRLDGTGIALPNVTDILVEPAQSMIVPREHALSTTKTESNSNLKTTKPQQEIAACLIIRDDNHRLPEWLAYHYHVLPLHKVVVTIDPRSVDDPRPILQQFQNELALNITIWGDVNFLSQAQLEEASKDKLHQRNRQYAFFQGCMAFLQNEGWKWTAMWDTDEFIHFQPKYRDAVDFAARGSISEFLTSSNSTTECHVINRIMVGAKEMKEDWAYLKHGMNLQRFQSLRYRYTADKNSPMNGRGKALINVQKIDPNEQVKTPHRPSFQICSPSTRSPFYISHYLGSWEIYSYRDDYRRGADRSYEAWMYRMDQTLHHYDDFLSKWLDGFVESVSTDKAQRLLANAGLDPNYNAVNKIPEWKCHTGPRCREYIEWGYKKKRYSGH